jgi:murein tripeptide amidase MpaA
MNPDGVFMGNYRTGIVGMDLNRNFNTGKQIYFPEIWALKNLIHKLK